MVNSDEIVRLSCSGILYCAVEDGEASECANIYHVRNTLMNIIPAKMTWWNTGFRDMPLQQ